MGSHFHEIEKGKTQWTWKTSRILSYVIYELVTNNHFFCVLRKNILFLGFLSFFPSFSSFINFFIRTFIHRVFTERWTDSHKEKKKKKLFFLLSLVIRYVTWEREIGSTKIGKIDHGH